MNVPVAKDLIQEVEGNLEIPEIRVWCHPPKIGKSGDDTYEVFDGFDIAIKFIKKHKEAERFPCIAFNGFEISLRKLGEQ